MSTICLLQNPELIVSWIWLWASRWLHWGVLVCFIHSVKLFFWSKVSYILKERKRKEEEKRRKKRTPIEGKHLVNPTYRSVFFSQLFRYRCFCTALQESTNPKSCSFCHSQTVSRAYVRKRVWVLECKCKERLLQKHQQWVGDVCVCGEGLRKCVPLWNAPRIYFLAVCKWYCGCRLKARLALIKTRGQRIRGSKSLPLLSAQSVLWPANEQVSVPSFADWFSAVPMHRPGMNEKVAEKEFIRLGGTRTKNLGAGCTRQPVPCQTALSCTKLVQHILIPPHCYAPE